MPHTKVSGHDALADSHTRPVAELGADLWSFGVHILER